MVERMAEKPVWWKNLIQARICCAWPQNLPISISPVLASYFIRGSFRQYDGNGGASMKTYRSRSWSDLRLEVRSSVIEGKGGFARDFIGVDEVVVVIGGTVMTDDEFRRFIPKVNQY